jgi:glycerol dehydrogenase-like iron-containing ADH family enzyme
MARLNKLQLYSIRWLQSQDKDIAFIANDLKLTEDQVKKAIEKFGLNQQDKNIKTKQSSAAKSLMISETMNKKSPNVSIMTKEASMYNDTVAKNINKVELNNKGYIFKPKK